MATAPYDSLEAVVNTARVRLLDAVVSLGGEIVTDTAVFTLTMINAAWRRQQEYLSVKGFSALNSEVILSNVPAWSVNDPGIFAWMDWENFFDGQTLQAAPVLPQDLITPTALYERANGSGGIYIPMDQVFDGLPTANPGSGAGTRDPLNRLWEWRGNAIYLPGATAATDIRLRYDSFFPDFLASGITPFSQQPVPIMRSLNSLAFYICSEAARARGDLDAGAFDGMAEAAAEKMLNRESRSAPSVPAGDA